MKYLVASDMKVATYLSRWLDEAGGAMSFELVEQKMIHKFNCDPMTEIDQDLLPAFIRRGESFIFKLENGFVSKYTE